MLTKANFLDDSFDAAKCVSLFLKLLNYLDYKLAETSKRAIIIGMRIK